MPKSDGFTLRLVLEGICTWVPDSPFFKQRHGKPVPGNPTSLTIMLPEQRATQIADWEESSPYWPVDDPCYSPPHAPVLILTPGDLHQPSKNLITGKFTLLQCLRPHPHVLPALAHHVPSPGCYTVQPVAFDGPIPH